MLFSSISILCLYLTCLRLNLPRWAGLAVAFLFAFENLSFLTGSLATLGVFMLTFMLAALLAFLDRKLVLAGLLAGLAALAKLPGVFVLGVFFLYWLVLERENWRLILIPICTSGITFLGLMTLLDFVIAGGWKNPLVALQGMLSFAASLSSTRIQGFALANDPWEWLVNRGMIFYSYSPQRIALVSYTVLCLVIPAVIYSIRGSFKKEKQAVIALAWFACTCLSWLVVSLIFHRLMYIWYFYPVVPGICLALGYGMQRFTVMAQDAGNHRLLISVKTGILLYLLVHLALFILLSPMVVPLVKWVYTG